MSARKLHFTLTEPQALAVIGLISGLDEHVNVPKPLETAANELDEQMAMQNSPWERCGNCGGSGWVEG